MPSAKQTDDPKAGAGGLAPNAPPPSALLLASESGSSPMPKEGPASAAPQQSSGYTGS